MSNIKIVALVTVKPEYTETLKPLFQSLVKASRAEEGNVSYDLHQEIGKPNRFVFVENWKSQLPSMRTMPANIFKVSLKPSMAKPTRSKLF